jgi:hypothetical protein
MVGTWFHSISPETGRIQWQGEILAEPEPGLFLVETYSWSTRSPYDRRLVPLEAMRDWLFYPSDQAMRESYDHGRASRLA